MGRWMSTLRGAPAATALVGLTVLGFGLIRSFPAWAETNPWSKHSQWWSVRAGYAKSTAEGSADGSVGFGFGYLRFWNSQWATGAYAHMELLGQYGGAAEIEVPWTLELQRHFKWNTSFRPYLGLGGGAFYHKFYRTGNDVSSVRPGAYLVGGGNVPISDHGLLGVDVRTILEADESMTNRIFGVVTDGPSPEVQEGTRWSVKVNYSWVY